VRPLLLSTLMQVRLRVHWLNVASVLWFWRRPHALGGTNEPLFLSGKGNGAGTSVYMADDYSLLGSKSVRSRSCQQPHVNPGTTGSPVLIAPGGASADANASIGIGGTGSGRVILGG